MAYKNVLIVGANVDVPQSILEHYRKPGYLVIGDKNKGFTLDDLEILQGNINENTRVDIDAHGSYTFFSQHIIGDTSFNGLYTKNVLKKIAYYSSYNPVHIHLWSCHAAFANKDVDVLPKGSVLVTHASEYSSISSLLNSAIEKTLINQLQSNNPFEAFSQEFVFGSMESSAFSISRGNIAYEMFEVKTKYQDIIENPRDVIQTIQADFLSFYEAFVRTIEVGVFSFLLDEKSAYTFAVNPSLKDVVENPRDVIQTIQADFISFYNDIRLKDLELASKFPNDLIIKPISDDQLEGFAIGSLISKSHIGSNQVVEMLIAPGMQSKLGNIINSQLFGFTPLWIASQEGHLETVKVLIAAGSDVDKANDSASTPLWAASQNGYLEIVKVLIAAGADVGKANDSGSTPLYIASQNGHLETVKVLIAAGADVDNAMDSGATPLYIASQNGHLETVEVLIAAGADVNSARDNGFTPLYIASGQGHIKVVKTLIKSGADVNKATNNGATPLAIATCYKKFDVSKLILQHSLKLLDLKSQESKHVKEMIAKYCPAELDQYHELVREVSEHYYINEL